MKKPIFLQGIRKTIRLNNHLVDVLVPQKKITREECIKNIDKIIKKR